jgi:hypothetical protein
MNLRLESIYIGAIPTALALLAVAWATFSGKVLGVRCQVVEKQGAEGGGTATDRSTSSNPYHLPPTTYHLFAARRADIFFWACVALVALLLAYGKYFPLYALFYKLPVVNNIRNPNKFLHVFQLALGILAAYGFDAALKLRGNSAAGSQAGKRG